MAEALYATFKTSLGEIVVKLLPEKAPKTVENFVGLAEGTKEWTDPRSGQKQKKPLYDGTVFHRVIPEFMIQGGDPLGTGTGGPGYKFADEIGPDNRFTKAGPARDGERRPEHERLAVLHHRDRDPVARQGPHHLRRGGARRGARAEDRAHRQRARSSSRRSPSPAARSRKAPPPGNQGARSRSRGRARSPP